MVNPNVHPELEQFHALQCHDFTRLAIGKHVEHFMVAASYPLELGAGVVPGKPLCISVETFFPLGFALPSVLSEVPGELAL